MGVHVRADYHYEGEGKKKRKVLKRYLIEFYDATRQPKRKRLSLGTKNRSAADQKKSALEIRYMAGQFDPWKEGLREENLPLSDGIKRFLKSREEKGCRPRTLENYGRILRLLEERQVIGVQLYMLDPPHVSAFLDRQRLNATSRATYLRHLKVFFKWCMERGYLNESPLPKEAGKRPQKELPEFLSREEYSRLLHTIESDAVLKSRTGPAGKVRWLADLVRFAANTGMRLGEVCHLRWSAVNLQTGFATVKNTESFKSKSGHERSIYLTGDALEVVTRLSGERRNEQDDYVFRGVAGDLLNGKYVSKRFRHYVGKAGLPRGYHFHTLRHTFASWAVLGGMDLYKLQEVLSHRHIETTMIYAHLRPDAQKHDMERIFGSSRSHGETESALREEVERLRAELEPMRAPATARRRPSRKKRRS